MIPSKFSSVETIFNFRDQQYNVDLLLMEMMLKTQMVDCFANDDGCVIQALGKLDTFFKWFKKIEGNDIENIFFLSKNR